MRTVKIEIRQLSNGYMLIMRKGNPESVVICSAVYRTEEFDKMMDEIKRVLLVEMGP